MRAIGRSLLRIAFFCMVVLHATSAFASLQDDGSATFDPSSVLQSQNRITYQVVIGDDDKGTMDVFSHQRGTFVPVDALLQRLGYHYTRDDNDHILQINFPDQTTLTLRFSKQEYISHGNTETLNSDDFIANGPDIFLNYEFLNKTFPVGFSLDQAAAKLRIIQRGQSPSADQDTTATPPDDFPVPQAAPRTWVIVDNIDQHAATAATAVPDDFPVPQAAPRTAVVTSDINSNNVPPVTPKTEAPASDVATPATEAPPAVAPPKATSTEPAKTETANEKQEAKENKDEEESLVLQPKIKQNPPSDLFIEAIGVGDKVYLPLADMMKLLEFDITVDGKAGTAAGSFISPDHNFSLDANSHQLRINHANIPLTDDNILVRNEQIYVNEDDFSKWFDMTCRFDRKMMMLAIDTKIALPMEARIARHNLWNKLLTTQGATTADYQPVENPYQLAAIPFVDVNLSSGYNNSSAQHYTGDYTIIGAGDLGYLTTNVYAAGSNQNPIDNLRITAGRSDPNGGLLGPLGATSFSIGDINSTSLELVTNNSLGRGVVVTNKALNSSDNFDTHTITGNAVPGWEVELYRNNLLLGFQTVDPSGRYEFLNEPLVYGTNNFRVVLYGPQGQTEEKVETIMIGSTMLKPGQAEYTMSVNQESASMIQFNSSNGATSTASNPQGLRAVGQTRYGINNFLTLGTGIVQTELPDGYHHYASMSADTSFAGIYTESNFIQDLNHGWVGGVTALTSIDDISIRALHRQYHDYESEVEVETTPGDFRKSVSEADLNGQFFMPLLEDFNFGVSALYETYTMEVPRTTYGASLSKSIWGMSFSNTFDYIQDTEKKFGGNFGWQTRVDNILFRADGTYDITPGFSLHDASFTAQYRIDDDLSAQTQIDQQLDGQSQATLTQTFNQDFEHFRLSYSGQINDQKQYVLGISLVFSLAHDDVSNRWHAEPQSLSSSGAIVPRVFVDENYNGQYDEGEKILPNAGLKINGIPPRAGQDNSFIAPVNSYEPVNVIVDPDALKDPTLSPAVNGYRVMTRPGDVVALDFPIVSTSEIDGNVTIADEKGERYQIPDIVVELDDENGKLVRRVASESDGFYVFEKVKPGNYTITVPAEALAQYHAELPQPLHIKIDKVADFRSGNDLLLKATGPLPPKLVKSEK